jgi:large subunit ribosomal protein L4
VGETVLNMHGEEVGDVELDPSVFAVPINVAVMHQAVKMQLANARQGTADTKTRGEVAGGAVKPWRQKGTGRARQGTIRSPLWIKGGVVFGPHPRRYTQKMPRKMRRLALKSALAAKLLDTRLILVDELSMDEPKTRDMITILQSVGAGPSTLILLAEPNRNVELSARNLPGIKILQANNLNVADLLNHDYLVITRSALDVICATYGDGTGAAADMASDAAGEAENDIAGEAESDAASEAESDAVSDTAMGENNASV